MVGENKDEPSSQDKKIEISETVVKQTPITTNSSQSVRQNNISNPPKLRYRPNNSFLKVKILSWDNAFHLPEVKTTGRNTIKEYLYWHNATFEKTRNSKVLIVYPKKRFGKLITTDKEVDEANQEYKEMVADILVAFQEKYAKEVALDITNAKFVIKEFELIHPHSKMPKNLRFKDTVGKKVYNNTGMEYYSPTYVKNTINNLALKDELPEIKQVVYDLSQQLKIHLSAIQNLEKYTRLLAERESKPSLLQRIMDKVKHTFHNK